MLMWRETHPTKMYKCETEKARLKEILRRERESDLHQQIEVSMHERTEKEYHLLYICIFLLLKVPLKMEFILLLNLGVNTCTLPPQSSLLGPPFYTVNYKTPSLWIFQFQYNRAYKIRDSEVLFNVCISPLFSIVLVNFFLSTSGEQLCYLVLFKQCLAP